MKVLLFIGLFLFFDSIHSESSIGDGFSFSFGNNNPTFSGTPPGTSSTFSVGLSQLSEVDSNGVVIASSSFGSPDIGKLGLGSGYFYLSIDFPLSFSQSGFSGYCNAETYSYSQAMNVVDWPGTSFAVPQNGLVVIFDFHWPVSSANDFFTLNGTVSWDISAQDIVSGFFSNNQLVNENVKGSSGQIIGETVGIQGGMSVTVEIPAAPIFNGTFGGTPDFSFSIASVPAGTKGSTTWTVSFKGICADLKVPVMVLLHGAANSLALPVLLIASIFALMKFF